jgi:hypothetical protein
MDETTHFIYLFACQNKYTLIFHCVHLTHARFTVWISVSLYTFKTFAIVGHTHQGCAPGCGCVRRLSAAFFTFN